MNKALQILAVLAIAIFIAQGAYAAEPIPGDSCTAGEEDNFLRSGGKEIPTGHFIVCKSGTWRSILSWDAAAAVTKIGNLTCATNEILKFNGTSWACAADASGMAGLPALTSANIWVGNASNAATAVTMSGDATLSNAGVLTIGSNAVGSAEITNASIALADLSATGTASATTYLRGDNTWVSIATGDAPTLDGLDSAQFLRSDADDSTTGRITSTGGLPASQVMATTTTGLGALEVQSQGSGGTAGAAFITFHRPGAYAAYFGIDTDSQLKFGGWSAGAASYKVWHAGNDGAASGLDADTLDGQDAAYFTNATNLSSGTVPTARLGSGTADGTTFLRGDNTWATPSGGGGITAVTTMTCTAVTTSGCTTAACTSGYFRTGCSAFAEDSLVRPIAFKAIPSGTAACKCTGASGTTDLTCYTYCAK